MTTKTKTKKDKKKDYSIIYLRPDGWWNAGSGFKTRSEAVTAGEGHNFGHDMWGIVPTDNLNDTLCEEALDD